MDTHEDNIGGGLRKMRCDISFDSLNCTLCASLNFISELELLPQLWQVVFVKVKCIRVSPNVQQFVHQVAVGILPKLVVEEVAVVVHLKQVFPFFRTLI